MKKEDLSVFIVPTGIGASIGGYAGDASCYAQMFAEDSKLIVNPNVVNAAIFSGITPNMLYTEGYLIDEFFKRKIVLRESKNNKIGIIFDRAIPQDVLNVHINTLNAVKTVYGSDILPHKITDEPVGVEFFVNKNGISSGRVKNADTLINAGKSLKEQGAQALGVVCLFDDSDDEAYESASGVDPVGGVEGILSHILSKEMRLSCAHAPAFADLNIPTRVVDPKAAAEYITPTFLPCILLGLKNAPQVIEFEKREEDDFCVDDVKSLIVPFNALGSIPVLEAVKRGIRVIGVKENKSVLSVDRSALSIDITHVDTYKEAKDLLKLF